MELLAIVIAVWALLAEPLKDPKEGFSLSNVARAGYFFVGLIFLAGGIKLFNSYLDSTAQARADAEQQARIDDLRSTNNHLIKVMSLGDGYNARIVGVVTFDHQVSESHVEKTLRNLFLKHVSIELEAKNKLGTYRGRVDYGAHPEVFRYLNAERLDASTPLLLSPEALLLAEQSPAFFFDIRCGSLKILNDEKIQYARFGDDPPVQATLATSPGMWRDFRQLYSVSEVFVDRVTLEELGDVAVGRRVDGQPR